MTQRRILCVGSLCLDTVVQLPPSGVPALGALAKASIITDFPGGGCGNSAVALARLGAKVTVAGKVGCDAEGDLIRRTMSCDSIAGVITDPEASTARSIVLLQADGTERSFLYRAGANERLRIDDVLPYVRQEYDALLVTDPFLTELGRSDLEALLRTAKRINMFIAVDFCWDPSGRWAADYPGVWPLVDVVLANGAEAAMLTGEQNPCHAASALLAAGTKAAIIKLGSSGMLAAIHNDIRTIPAYDTQVRDPTGAGDWCNAGVLLSYLNGGSLFEAAINGCMAGAAAVKVIGGSSAIPSTSLLRACAGNRMPSE